MMLQAASHLHHLRLVELSWAGARPSRHPDVRVMRVLLIRSERLLLAGCSESPRPHLLRLKKVLRVLLLHQL